MIDLTNSAEIFDGPTKQAFDDLSARIKYVTSYNISSDFWLFKIFNDHMSDMDNPTILESACKIYEDVRDTITSYKSNLAQLVNDFKDKIVPDVSQVKEGLTDLAEQSKHSTSENIEKGRQELGKWNDELQAASSHIQNNVDAQFGTFNKKTEGLATAVDDALEKLTGHVKELLPEKSKETDAKQPE